MLTPRQETEEEHFRMQELQQQEQDITGAHSLRRQAALPGTARDEYCHKIVHEESQRRAMMRWPDSPPSDSVSRRCPGPDRDPPSFLRDSCHTGFSIRDLGAMQARHSTTTIVTLKISVCLVRHCKAWDLYYHWPDNCFSFSSVGSRPVFPRGRRMNRRVASFRWNSANCEMEGSQSQSKAHYPRSLGISREFEDLRTRT
jgi:hypothetical protein